MIIGQPGLAGQVILNAAGPDEPFIAAPNSDRRAYFPYLHIAGVETLDHSPRKSPSLSSRPRRGRPS